MLLHAPAGEFESNRSMRVLIDLIYVLWLMNVKELHMDSSQRVACKSLDRFTSAVNGGLRI